MTTFQVVEADCPAGVVDRMLWLDAQHILRRHCDHTAENMCVWCGREWPCGPRRLAERAQAAAYRPARAPWGVYEEVTRGIRVALNERPTRPAPPTVTGPTNVRPGVTSGGRVAAASSRPGVYGARLGGYPDVEGRHRFNRRAYDTA
ncbi:hypothetical protein ACFQX7_23750 [Luedemannella flava]|uniref:hypothetical protein n=1 Tax=Luedemannella flava TaxID=349316 RepID=UPI0031E2FC97